MATRASTPTRRSNWRSWSRTCSRRATRFSTSRPSTADFSHHRSDLAAHLARSGLIDEYRLYIHPVLLGGGKPYFHSGLSLTLKPLGKESLTQGVTLLRYAPAG
ncbi:dihydrofolate reductase family protein [Mesorhizobium sp.]|uniref:dihydrofolate reductase family protein n=1 Tax=Mesorhizobium sp. TaxID=1871066 RepID=UPI00257D03C1|nr:dihydrofolate reductase family protein [Mesorhizobium sp.]